ncbi:hypothetical protein MRI28_09810, partial [Nocardiopsis dassonvillei]|nr:hypothetical protein [Nocardiopsis dassonvillei]
MAGTWKAEEAGVLALPSGRLVRGRGLRRPLPPGPAPDLGLYLAGEAPEPVPRVGGLAGGWVL